MFKKRSKKVPGTFDIWIAVVRGNSLKQRVVVTGGAGFIGSHLVDHLSRDREVIVLDDFSTGRVSNLRHANRQNLRIVKGNVYDQALTRRISRKAEAIFHQAAIASIARTTQHPSLTNRVNIDGTLSVLLAARENKVPKVILASSSSVYGENREPVKREDMPLRPISIYATSKLAAENYATAFYRTFGVRTVTLRYFNVYGPRQSNGMYSGVISKFVRSALNEKPITIYGDGRQERDFIFVTDVVKANIAALDFDQASGNAYNIGTGKSTTIRELSRRVKQVCEKPRLRVVNRPARTFDVKISRADISKAHRDMKYSPKVSLNEGLGRTADWFQNNAIQR